MTFHRRLLAACLLCIVACAAHADALWIDKAEDGSTRVHLYFFWSLRCPHCLEAIPLLQTLASEYPWLQVHSRELTQSQDNVTLYVDMANEMGEEARFVPAFFVCGRMRTGYDSPEGTGREVLNLVQLCYELGAADSETIPEAEPSTPWNRSPKKRVRNPSVKGDLSRNGSGALAMSLAAEPLSI